MRQQLKFWVKLLARLRTGFFESTGVCDWSTIMNERERDEAVAVACKLWRYFNSRDWEAARKLLTDDFEAYWPQSREKIFGADNFIALNREYPGKGTIQVEDHRCGFNNWDKIFEVTTTARIKWEKANGEQEELYVISFFEINWEGQIQSAVEYWANTYPAPEWRKSWVEKY